MRVTPASALAALAALTVTAGACGSTGSLGRADPGAGTSGGTASGGRDVPAATATVASDPTGSDGADTGRRSAGEASRQDATTLDRDAAVAAAVAVRAEGCPPRSAKGAGAHLDEGLVVTAAHVVAGSDTVEVIGLDGVSHRAEVVLFDPGLDVAVLRSAGAGDPLAVRPDDAGAGDSGVVVVLHVDRDAVRAEIIPVEVTRPVTIRTTDIYRELDVVRTGFELDGTIEVGDSGGVVVLPGGAAGVVWARSTQRDGRAWAIDLPPAVRDPAARAALVGPVDTGRCAP